MARLRGSPRTKRRGVFARTPEHFETLSALVPPYPNVPLLDPNKHPLLRRRVTQRNREAFLEDDDHPSPARLPHEQLESKELAMRLRCALARLPDGQAEVFCLFHLEDWSYREIAESLSISTDLVGVWLQRAKAKLRELLADVDPATLLAKEVPHE